MSPKYPPREGDEEIVFAALDNHPEEWVSFMSLEPTCRSKTRDQVTEDGRWDHLGGRRLVTVLQRLKRRGLVEARPDEYGSNAWRRKPGADVR